MKRLVWMMLTVGSLTVACGDDDASMMDTEPDPMDSGSDTADATDAADTELEDTSVDTAPDAPDTGPPCDGPPGLYVDGSCTVLAEGVRFYDPRYWLWSDGTDKERYIKLPEGETINSDDPDGWVFPTGTTIWKTFSQGGVRLETRIMTKSRDGVGIASWDMQTFAWNEDQDDVVELTGGQDDVLGTDHDIPSQENCARCHFGGSPDNVLGFGAIQLNHVSDGITLRDLNMEELLSTPIDPMDAVVPGEDLDTRNALGYLHSNCGPCHGGITAPLGMKFWIQVGVPLAEQDAITTNVGVESGFVREGLENRITPGDPNSSTVLFRMNNRTEGEQMPPLATEQIDSEAVALIRRWIEALPVPDP